MLYKYKLNKKQTLIFSKILLLCLAIIAITFNLNFSSRNCGAQNNDMQFKFQQTQQPQQTTKIKTIKPNVLTIGTNATLTPFEYLNENNQIIGFDIDLIKHIANKLDLKPEIIDMPFDAIIPAVESGKIDLGIAAITKNEEREKVVNFTNPYYISNQSILILNETKMETEADLDNKTVAVQQGTISQDTIESLIKEKGKHINLKTYSDYLTMVEDLLISRIDAIVLDRDTGKSHANQHKNKIKFLDGTTFNWADEPNCIACSKQNPALLNALNQQIETLKNEPFYKNLIEKYMGSTSSNEEQHQNLNKPIQSETNKNSLTNQFHTAFLKNNRWKLYLKGLSSTVQITIFAAMIGLTFGISLAIMQVLNFKKFNFLKSIFKLFVDLVRGTPLLLQLFIVWFAIMKHSKHPILVAIITCGINSSAYVCEIIRGAINAIDKNQTEAGLAMGFSPLQTLWLIILPQGLRNSIPALCNEIVSLLKETAIVGYIAIVDLTRAADQIRAATYLSLMPLLISAAIYFTLTKLASLALGLIERKLSLS